jgi:CRISPR-associated protein Cas2
MADKKTWIIAYDVTGPGRLQRVHKYLVKRAFALQYSVFVADLSDKGLANVKRHLAKLIDEKEDDVRFYAAPKGLDVQVFGVGRLPMGVYVFGEGAAKLAGRAGTDIGHADTATADEVDEMGDG